MIIILVMEGLPFDDVKLFMIIIMVMEGLPFDDVKQFMLIIMMMEGLPFDDVKLRDNGTVEGYAFERMM